MCQIIVRTHKAQEIIHFRQPMNPLNNNNNNNNNTLYYSVKSSSKATLSSLIVDTDHNTGISPPIDQQLNLPVHGRCGERRSPKVQPSTRPGD